VSTVTQQVMKQWRLVVARVDYLRD